MEKSTVEIVNEFYEGYMFGDRPLAFDKIGFFNFGYWNGVHNTVELAQLNLIETLVNFFVNFEGNVLDVACGKGASSQFLTKYFSPNNVFGINISERQLQICMLIAPKCQFRLMDATRLEFPEASFDNVLCIESADHFMTRYKFLEEAYRVLKPKGRLAMLDFVHDREILDLIGPAHPKENYLPNLNAYRESLVKIGYRYVRVEDSTHLCIEPMYRFLERQTEREFDRTGDQSQLEQLEKMAHVFSHTRSCMVYAIK